MLNAQQVNTIVGSLMGTLEQRVPTLPQLSLGAVEGVRTPGTYGSIIMGALFTGGMEGKLTLILEWITGFQLAEAVTQARVDGFNDVVQQALESLFNEATQGMMSAFAQSETPVQIRVLPTLVDTSVLLGEDGGGAGALKIPIQADSGTMNLFLSFR